MDLTQARQDWKYEIVLRGGHVKHSENGDVYVKEFKLSERTRIAAWKRLMQKTGHQVTQVIDEGKVTLVGVNRID